MGVELDAIDWRLLGLLQRDAGVSNQALAAAAHVSPATALRRVKRLRSGGLIDRVVAHLDPAALAQVGGPALVVVVEVSLDRQDSAALDAFEARAVAQAAVQQCYRVSPGPDFILVVHCASMDAYAALAQGLFTADANVRNVKAFFSVRRAKFGAAWPLPGGANVH